ncbi:hypothetical protein TrST_g11883 [Triparma strigata]|uniref:Uncharacterized protein n=1 Tax=Triparma strigata TaxID=1606541 RepID=A0A9W7ERK9_9STRA|nr:hypothetical protein TrST_g11883 [Triparma strigata]
MENDKLLEERPSTDAEAVKRRKRTVEDEVKSPKLLLLILCSIVITSSNQVVYKKLLNRFSAPTHNYEFFVSQWTTLLYIVPSLVVVMYKVTKMNPLARRAHKIEIQSTQNIYWKMGLLDAASSTLGAIGGALTPGQLQTLLGQTIIPITILLSIVYIKEKFKTNQIVGAVLILLGSILASVPFLLGGSDDDEGSTSSASSSADMASILIFASSIVPAAMSNVYKEANMKEKDLEVYTTTTFISIWQELLGFAFLPLLMLKAFGGLSQGEILKQMEYGYECYNERPPLEGDDCSGAFSLFWIYVLINWLLNVLLLILTKEGSAVMLVIANALALPITNVAFSVQAIMGDDVEPFSAYDLLGLLLVIVGFLVYSNFGLGKRTTLATGPPGQMTYHVVDGPAGSFVLTAHHALDPRRLASFLVALHGGSFVQGSVSAALELAKKTVSVLEKFKVPKPGNLEEMMTPRMENGAIRGVGRISPSSYEYGNDYGSVEGYYDGSLNSGDLKRSMSHDNL